MSLERRKHRRILHPLDGSWRGASAGRARCRISDLSVSGCFVHGIAAPQPGEETVITLHISATHDLSLASEVVYVENAIGFGIRFRDLSPEHEAELKLLVASFIKESA